MALDNTTLPEGVEVVCHGCGEHFPEVATEDGEEEPDNRRVEMFVFPRGVQPEPPNELSKDGSTEYPDWIKQTAQTINFRDIPTKPAELELEWLQELFDLLPSDLIFRLTSEGQDTQERRIQDITVRDGMMTVDFRLDKQDFPSTFEVVSGDRSIHLWMDQLVANFDEAPLWDQVLEEFIVDEQDDAEIEIIETSMIPDDLYTDQIKLFNR